MARTERFSGLMSLEEKKALALLADNEGLSEAAWVRRKVRETARALQMWPVKGQVPSALDPTGAST